MDYWEEKYGHLQPDAEDMRDYFISKEKSLNICCICLRNKNCGESSRKTERTSWKDYRNTQYK